MPEKKRNAKKFNMSTEKDIEALIGSMSLDEKIGQLFMIGVNGTEANADSIEMVEKYGAGGVILFARNITGGAQVKKMIAGLAERAKYPLAISIDQEGGLVLRLTTGATVLGGNMALAACGGKLYDEYCAEWGRITGEELRELGFTLNLAPVLDVNNIKNPGIGARSFSDDPALCARLGASLIRSVQKQGVSACAKHFPGKGNASVDAHLDLPVIDSTLDEMRNFELVPFKSAIEAGVDAAMTAHVVYRGIEGETLPATLSYKVLTGLLKDELGFEGPLITDDMEMGAIKNYYEQHEACFRSFMSGADIILICHTKELQIKTMNYFKEKYICGELCDERLTDALTRIFRMKSRHESLAGAEGRAIDYDKNAEFAQKLADASVTLVSDEAGILEKIRIGALDLKKMKNIFLVEAKFSAITQVEDVEENSALLSMMEKELSGTAVKLIHEKFDVKIEPAKAAELFDKLASAGLRESLAIVITYNAHIFKGQNELAELVTGNAAYSIAAAVRNPYDLMTPGGKTCKIATYGFRRSNMRSLFNTIISGLKPPGVLPVKFK
jgi:beta-N-acetylhexosaminidase